MTEEMNGEKKGCSCGTLHAFCAMVLAAFVGCTISILLIGAFAKPPMMPCPCMMGHKYMHKMMHSPMGEAPSPFMEKTRGKD